MSRSGNAAGPAPWRREGAERIQSCRVFEIDRVRFARAAGAPAADYFVIDAPDWVNVIPATDDGRIVFVRQFRVGVSEYTLEIPGGMCDPGESPADTARRELREETGYAAGEMVDLGWVHPNPAIQTNRCHTFLAKGARAAGAPEPQGDEEFELVTVPEGDVASLVKSGAITHALVVAAFYKLGLL